MTKAEKTQNHIYKYLKFESQVIKMPTYFSLTLRFTKISKTLIRHKAFSFLSFVKISLVSTNSCIRKNNITRLYEIDINPSIEGKNMYYHFRLESDLNLFMHQLNLAFESLDDSFVQYKPGDKRIDIQQYVLNAYTRDFLKKINEDNDDRNSSQIGIVKLIYPLSYSFYYIPRFIMLRDTFKVQVHTFFVDKNNEYKAFFERTFPITLNVEKDIALIEETIHKRILDKIKPHCFQGKDPYEAALLISC